MADSKTTIWTWLHSRLFRQCVPVQPLTDFHQRTPQEQQRDEHKRHILQQRIHAFAERLRENYEPAPALPPIALPELACLPGRMDTFIAAAEAMVDRAFYESGIC